jgi:predicted Zn-dependent peptidase
MPELSRSAFFVRQEAHVLPGMFVMGASVHTAEAARTISAARGVLRQLATSPVTTAEFERAKGEALAVFNKQLDQPESLAGVWLDMETYKLPPVPDQLRALSQLSLADMQRVAARLFRDAPLAAVVIGPAAQVTADLERDGKIELAGPANKPAPPTPAKSPL